MTLPATAGPIESPCVAQSVAQMASESPASGATRAPLVQDFMPRIGRRYGAVAKDQIGSGYSGSWPSTAGASVLNPSAPAHVR